MEPDESTPHDQPATDNGTPTVPDPHPEQRLSRKSAWLAMGAVVVALALIWIAPGVGDSDHESLAGGSQDGEESEGGLTAGQDAPLHFTLKDMHGVDVKLETFRGKVILVNFWATWCGPCRVEIPDLVELQDRYRDDLVVLGMLVLDDFDARVPTFAAKYKMNYPILDGSKREDVESAYAPMWGLPTSYIIGRDGRIARKYSGIASKEQFEQEIKALL